MNFVMSNDENTDLLNNNNNKGFKKGTKIASLYQMNRKDTANVQEMTFLQFNNVLVETNCT